MADPIRIAHWVQMRAHMVTGSITWSVNYDFDSTPVDIASNAQMSDACLQLGVILSQVAPNWSASTGLASITGVTNYPTGPNYSGGWTPTTPVWGSIAGDYTPGNVAVYGIFYGNQRGRRHMGKQKWSFVPESDTSGGILTTVGLQHYVTILSRKLMAVGVDDVVLRPTIASRAGLHLSSIATMIVDTFPDSTRKRMAGRR